MALKSNREGSFGLWLLFVGVVLAILFSYQCTNSDHVAVGTSIPHTTQPEVHKTEAQKAQESADLWAAQKHPQPPQPIAKPEPNWIYETKEDTMGRTVSFAEVISDNTLDFDFPYQGVQHGRLEVRETTKTGMQANVRIERGQFLCHISECSVNIRFDDGPVRRVSAQGAADYSTTILFLESSESFFARMRKAKVLRVEAMFYQQGSRTLEFNVEGFKW